MKRFEQYDAPSAAEAHLYPAVSEIESRAVFRRRIRATWGFPRDLRLGDAKKRSDPRKRDQRCHAEAEPRSARRQQQPPCGRADHRGHDAERLKQADLHAEPAIVALRG